MARPFAFMNRLSGMAVKLLQDMRATGHDEEKVQLLRGTLELLRAKS
jgi:hypothetical protein